MHGRDVGQLNVYVEASGGRRLLVGLVGEQGELWKKLQVRVESEGEFRLGIEGVVSVVLSIESQCFTSMKRLF